MSAIVLDYVLTKHNLGACNGDSQVLPIKFPSSLYGEISSEQSKKHSGEGDSSRPRENLQFPWAPSQNLRDVDIFKRLHLPKNIIVDGIHCPSTLKRLARRLVLSNELRPGYDVFLSSSVANVEAACGVSNKPEAVIIAGRFLNFMMAQDLIEYNMLLGDSISVCKRYKFKYPSLPNRGIITDLLNPAPGMLAILTYIVPSTLGGFSTMNMRELLFRRFPDPLANGISHLLTMANHLQNPTLKTCLITQPLKQPGSLRNLILDPVSINLMTAGTAEKMMEKMIVNSPRIQSATNRHVHDVHHACLSG